MRRRKYNIVSVSLVNGIHIPKGLPCLGSEQLGCDATQILTWGDRDKRVGEDGEREGCVRGREEDVCGCGVRVGRSD